MRHAASSEVPAEHRTAVRVRYPETDRMQVAYHAHYLVWFELGRTELMRAAGCTYGELEDQSGIGFPVIEVGVRYVSSARYDDLLTVGTRLVSVGKARVRFEYRIVRDRDERLLTTGFSEHATVGPEGRPMRMPEKLRQKLEAWESAR